MKTFFVILLILLPGCTLRDRDDPYAEKVLAKEHDTHGRLVKKIITERSPGEDVELVVTRYDTLGRVVAEYGIAPYGNPFRHAFLYDTGRRPVEKHIYTLTNLDPQRYGMQEALYTLSDTLPNLTGVVDVRITYTYDDAHHRVFEREFERDSLNRFILYRIDTLEHE